MEKRRESKSFGFILCLLIGILIGSLGTYYVLSTNYTNETNRLKREINKKEDELEKLQKQKEKTKEESIDITSDDTKKEYNQVLNQKLKPVLMYLNDTRTTYDDSDFTDLEMTNATCYYLKEQDDDSIFEQENNSDEQKTILFSKINPFVKTLFGVELVQEQLDETILKDDKITCQYDKDMKEVLYKVTKIVDHQETDEIEITYDDISSVLEDEEKKDQLEDYKKDDYFDYEESDVKAKYQLILKKTSDDTYQIISNKKI